MPEFLWEHAIVILVTFALAWFCYRERKKARPNRTTSDWEARL